MFYLGGKSFCCGSVGFPYMAKAVPSVHLRRSAPLAARGTLGHRRGLERGRCLRVQERPLSLGQVLEVAPRDRESANRAKMSQT